MKPMEFDSDKRRGTGVQSVERSLMILEEMAANREPMTLKEIAQACGLKLSTAHRLLATLIMKGFACQDVYTGQYRLGIKAFQIGSAALYSLDMKHVVRPHMHWLVGESQETANLCVLGRTNHNTELICIDQVESPRMMRSFANIGSRMPVHCTGSGKILLAQLETADLETQVKVLALERFTEKTITDPARLLADLKSIKLAGFAVDNEETEIGVLCIAVPIRNHENQVVAAISVSGPVSRMLPFEKQLGLLKEAAARISAELGSQDFGGWRVG